MHTDYPAWLAEQKYVEGTQKAQISRIKKVEKYYGDLNKHLANGTYQDVINDLNYSTNDERANKPNTSKIKFKGDIRNNLQSYKNAVVRYRKFLNDNGFKSIQLEAGCLGDPENMLTNEESNGQRLSLERDMQAALRRNIASLDPALEIIDDGAERSVNSGLIDITCDDGNSIVVIELKAGKADSRAIGQILGYMGDLQEEEGGKPVRGILVAESFDKRTKAAARVVPTLALKTYSIEFKFTQEN